MKEKDKYEKMKENVQIVIEKQEKMRLNSVNSRSKKITRWWMIYISSDLTGWKMRKFKQKIFNILCHQFLLFFFCMYKMVDSSAETQNNAGVSALKIHEDDD